MTGYFAKPVEEVVHTVGGSQPPERVFSSPDEVRAVVASVDCGLCRLVPLTQHRVRLHDVHWNVTVGIELTKRGEALLAH